MSSHTRRGVATGAKVSHLECLAIGLHSTLDKEWEHLVDHFLVFSLLKREDIVWSSTLQGLSSESMVVGCIVLIWAWYIKRLVLPSDAGRFKN